MDVTFFETPADLRAWFAQHHETEKELWVGFHKKGTGKPSITWPESVDEALCVGWIDGIRKSIDEKSYKIRFTPRKATSNWSAVNIKRVAELTEMGRMRPAGLKAFETRDQHNDQQYSYENEARALADEYAQQFQANEKAWAFFQAQPPGYQKTAVFWVMSAKKEETRLRRLATLMEDSENERRLANVTPPSQSK